MIIDPNQDLKKTSEKIIDNIQKYTLDLESINAQCCICGFLISKEEIPLRCSKCRDLYCSYCSLNEFTYNNKICSSCQHLDDRKVS